MKSVKYISALDGLRGICILPVIFKHLGFVNIHAYVGVQGFFVISGFLIFTQLLDEIEYSNLQDHKPRKTVIWQTGSINLRKFYLRRIARLLPSAALIWLLSVIFLVITRVPLETWILGLIGSFTFTTNVLISFFGYRNISSSFEYTWSLGVTEQFYLFGPLFLSFLYFRLKLSYKRILMIILCMSLAVIAVNKVMWILVADGTNFLDRLGLASPLYLFGILFGCTLALARKSYLRIIQYFTHGHKFDFMSLVAIFLIALLVVENLPWSKDMSLLVSAILFGIIILKVYVSEFSFTSKVLNFYILRTIGKISYILFLANMLFKNFVEHYTKKELLDLNSFSKLISITILMIISWFIYNYFENPLRNYLNKRFQLK